MDPDRVGHDELHARQPHAIDRQPPPARRGRRVGEVQHHLRPRPGHGVESDVLDGDLGRAGIDEALLALGAGDRHLLSVVEDMGGVAGADDGRKAKLAAHDGGVRGAPAVVGDDGGRPLHDRHPVGVGRGGDQDRAVDEAVDLGGGVQEADLASRHRLTDAEARRQHRSLCRHAVAAERGGLGARFHRLGPGLHDVEHPGLAVLRPFHVHRLAVVVLDHRGLAGEGEDLGVGKHEGFPFGLRGRHVPRGPGGAPRVDHLLFLRAERLGEDRRQPLARQEGLVDLVFVRIDGTLHDVLAQPPGCVDQHHLVEARFRVDGEHDARAAKVGTHHELHPDRQRHLHVREPLQRCGS